MRYFGCHRKFNILTGFMLIALAIGMAGCGHSTAKFLAKGEEYLQKRKFHEALMQFKAAAESDKSSAQAHWGMARAYENLGQVNETLDELRKTVELDGANLDAKAKLGNYYLLVQPPMIAEAEKIQQEIVTADPKFVEGTILSASILAARSRPDREVVAKLNEAIAIDPARVESYISLARYYMTKDMAPEAEAAIQKAISVGPERALGYVEYGRFFMYAKRDAEAEAQFNKAVSVESASIEAREAQADFYVTTRQLDKAETVYKQLVQIQENSPESRLELAEFYAGAARQADAISVLEGVISENPEYARARYRVGQLYLADKNYPKVQEQLDELLKLNNNDSEALLLKSRLSLQQGKTDEAISDLETILKKTPSDRDALFYMAQAKLNAGQVDQCRAFLGDLDRYHPTFLRPGLIKIQAAVTAGERDNALKAADELLTKIGNAQPNADMGVQALMDLQIKALSARGLAYLDLGKFAEARADLQNVIEQTPNSPTAMINLARVAAAEKKNDEAMSLYERALAIEPQNFDAVSGMVTLCIQMKRLPQAYAKIDALIAQNAGRGDVLAALHYLKSQVYISEKNQQSAEAELATAIELDPNYLPAYSAYASILVDRQQTVEAIDQYQKVLARRPSASTYTLLGILEDSRGNVTAAEVNYRKALEMSNDSPIAANNLAWLIVENQGNLDEALSLATSSVSRNQSVPGYYDTLGWVYLKKGLNSPAVEQFRKAIAIDEKLNGTVNPGYRVRLAMALANSGDKASAKREAEISLQQAKDLSQQEVNDAKRVISSL